MQLTAEKDTFSMAQSSESLPDAVELDRASHATTDGALADWIDSILPDAPEAGRELGRTLNDNPGRISRAYRSLLSGYLTDPKTILKITVEVPGRDHAGLVSTARIPFLSFCAHHFLPFFGTVDIVYEPGPYIIGIGKMPRLVECRARRFQLQEFLVRQIAEDMSEFAEAKGVYVRSTARHCCVCFRGPEDFTAVNTTTYSLGTLAVSTRMPEIISVLNAG
jgi:GTP cyclohydrolase IA